MFRDRLLRDIRELRINFAAKYGRPMTSDEIRTLELAEKLARSMTKPTVTFLPSDWTPEQDHHHSEPPVVVVQ